MQGWFIKKHRRLGSNSMYPFWYWDENETRVFWDFTKSFVSHHDRYTLGSKIIRTLEIIRVKKLISNTVL